MSAFQYNNLVSSVASTATSGGTTTLTNVSACIQVFTGSANQTVVLPVATTFTEVGISYQIYNLSSGSVQVNYQDSTAFKTVAAGTSLVVTLVSNGTADGTWVAFTTAPAATASSARTINAQTGTTYTFALTDGSNNGNNPLVTFGSSSATTVTVPTNASVAFPVGTQIDCIQQGSGAVTFSPASGVTINSNGGLVIGAQYVGVSLIQTAANTWTIVGYLT